MPTVFEPVATVQQLDATPHLRERYRSHWLQCEFQTATCPICTAYTKTDHFNNDYRRTEPIMPDTRRSPFDYPAVTRPSYFGASAGTSKPPVGSQFKTATSACPYGDQHVTFIVFRSNDFVNNAGADVFTIQASTRGRFCKNESDKIQALLDFKPGIDLILVAWPGKDTQDIFAITTKEQRDKALVRFGLKTQPTPTTTFTAADGTVFVQEVK